MAAQETIDQLHTTILRLALLEQNYDKASKVLSNFEDPDEIRIGDKTPLEYLKFVCDKLPNLTGGAPKPALLALLGGEEDSDIIWEEPEEEGLSDALRELDVNEIVRWLAEYENAEAITIDGQNVTDFFMDLYFQIRPAQCEDDALGQEIWELLWLKTNPKKWAEYLEVRDASDEGLHSSSEPGSPVEKLGMYDDNWC